MKFTSTISALNHLRPSCGTCTLATSSAPSPPIFWKRREGQRRIHWWRKKIPDHQTHRLFGLVLLNIRSKRASDHEQGWMEW